MSNANQEAEVAYVELMEDAKQRLALLRRITSASLRQGAENFDYECASIQLRKLVEAIAFGSLCANKSANAKVHANFERHDRARDLLLALEKINPGSTPHRYDSVDRMP